jgi:hypothetical protein
MATQLNKEHGVSAVADRAAAPSGPSLQAVSGTAGITNAGSVYAKVAVITGILAQHGIAKNRDANFGKFRGIDDVYKALAPLLAQHRLCVFPRMVARESVERRSSKGNALFYVTVEAEFDFVCADDGSIHTARTFGEAMDSSDKATNKAMSAAYKYAAFMTFCIPTEGDADAETHDVSGAMPEAEYTKLIQLIEATKSNVPMLLKAIGVDPKRPLIDLSMAEYEKALSALETKLARMAKEETNAKAKETAHA